MVRTLVLNNWTYKNNYKFLTNNCTDEVLSLIKKIRPINDVIQGFTVNKPFTLLTLLKKGDLIDRRFDIYSKNNIGSYWVSSNNYYDQVLKLLKNKYPNIKIIY